MRRTPFRWANSLTPDVRSTQPAVYREALDWLHRVQRHRHVFRPGQVVVDFGHVATQHPGGAAATAGPAMARWVGVPQPKAAAAINSQESSLVPTGGGQLSVRSSRLKRPVDGLLLGVAGAATTKATSSYPGLELAVGGVDSDSGEVVGFHGLAADRGPLVEALLGHKQAAAEPTVDVAVADLWRFCAAVHRLNIRSNMDMSAPLPEGEVDPSHLWMIASATCEETMHALSAVEPLLTPSSSLLMAVARPTPTHRDSDVTPLVASSLVKDASSRWSRLWNGVAGVYRSVDVVDVSPLETPGLQQAVILASGRRTGVALPAGSKVLRGRNGAVGGAHRIGTAGQFRSIHRTTLARRGQGGTRQGKRRTWSTHPDASKPFHALRPQKLHDPLPADHWARTGNEFKDKAASREALFEAKYDMHSSNDVRTQRDD